jgi:hypothetical protein
MTAKLKTAKLKTLQATIKGFAADGRKLRTEAATLYGLDRYEAKAAANDVGDTARRFQLAYALLRGREIESVESPDSRTPFNVEHVVAVIGRHYTPREGVDTQEFLDACKAKLHAWNRRCYQNRESYPGRKAARHLKAVA